MIYFGVVKYNVLNAAQTNPLGVFVGGTEALWESINQLHPF